jgi:IS605 OrfB family transposase
MQRTVRLLLNTTAEQVVALTETTRQFTEAFNAVCGVAWDANERNGVNLHHLTYKPLKLRFPSLVSDHHIQARVKATEAVKSAFTRRKQGLKAGCPKSVKCPPRYNVHTFKIHWEAGTATLSTTSGRLLVPFVLPGVFDWAKTGKVCTADLVERGGGRFFLHAVIESDVPTVAPDAHVVGVDLGLCHPAVTSEKRFLGKRSWKEVEARIFRQKRRCQAKRTKSSKRRLKILSGQQARFRRDCDHVLSKQIVGSVMPGGTVVLENLTDIRKGKKATKKFNRRVHGWSFAQLKRFVVYKAEAVGVRVELIDPRHTSQTCSSCGHQHRSNRRSQSLFKCRQCAFTLNADLNAARNIRAKHLAGLGISLTGRPPSTGPTGRKTQCRGAKAATRKPPV